MINTVTEWSANITTPESAISPDNFEGLAGSIPPNNFVISRNKFGKIASVYSDNEWNFKAYNIRGTPSTLYFNSWFKGPTEEAHLLIIQELKHIMFSYIWYRHGKPYSVKNISRFTTTLNILALFAFQKRITVVNLLQSKELLAVCIQDLPGGSVYPLQSFLRALITIGSDILGFLPCSPEKISGFQSIITQYRASLKQHPPIPSRIYSLYITKLQNHLSLIEQHIDRYIELIQVHESNSYNGLTFNAQKVRARKEGKKFLSSSLTVQIAKKHNHKYIYSKNHLTLDQLITSKKLDQFFDQYPIRATPHGLASGLVNIQFICKTIIHLFSGMRHSEVRFLPFNCASSYTKNGVNHSIIRGYTTKFNEKETEWITNKDGIKAINIAQKIALYVCDFLSINPNKVDSIPLFISPAYTGIGTKYIKKPSDKVFMPSLLITSSEIK
ncbi:hypothetical protein WH96_20545 [Kiloniella spongiae]|uniref:Uncharacterized protein n=1 Tax=Kiloniella spongiae TaxID=1489064 RepID=A0A0H2M9T4_9PROT|nr:hypothetical protein [Kiloniella spongiae]KLN58896.1 hypothetical protein WH96_20545 [Kiloniella spongiae]